MVKRPPKPEGQEAQPRFKPAKERHFSAALEAARRLTDSEVVASEMDFGKYFETDDRSFAILRGANVENALEISVSKRIKVHKGERRALFRSDGPLGSFANKITMAYALDIIGPTTKGNLDVIRHVRNVFAHAKTSVDFTTKEVIDLCSFFKFPPRITPTDRRDDDEIKKYEINRSPARKSYFISTALVEISLLRFSARATEKRLTELGPSPSPALKPRIAFDDTLP